MAAWLVKEEPDAYPWERFAAEGRTAWTGVRNYGARLHLRAMKKGDPVVYYHTGRERAAVGLARVVREAYPDPTVDPGAQRRDWSAVDLEAQCPFPRPVPLSVLREDSRFRDCALLRQGRLSVLPLSEKEFQALLELAGLDGEA